MSGNDLAHNELNFNLCAKMSKKWVFWVELNFKLWVKLNVLSFNLYVALSKSECYKLS